MSTDILQYRLKEVFGRFKDRIALEWTDFFITYSELEKRAGLITDNLLAKGIKKEEFVGILSNNRIDLITAIVGIVRAGGVFVPLDTGYPENRIQVMIDTTDTRFIVCDLFNYNRFMDNEVVKSKGVELLRLSDFDRPREDRRITHDSIDFQFLPADKIYIYFTSGTTGIPKAIVGKNECLLHFINWEIETFNVNETFRFSQFTNPGFDVFLRDIFVPLCCGGTICIPETNEGYLSGQSIVRWIDGKNINLMHCVPSLFRVFNTDSLKTESFKSLKYILFAGEKVIPGELERWYKTFGDRIQLVNLYGPTETTLAKMFYLIQATDIERDIMPVGRHIKGSRTIVLDENMELCDKLALGEIYIRTPFRSHGYLNDPQLNAQKFVPNPFSSDPDDLLYATGDLGRLLPDGNVELLGRVDRQVKIRGIRVELDEVENIMMKYPLIKEAVVVKREISERNQFLFSFITINEIDSQGVIPALRDYLSKQLPENMIPSDIHIIEQFPRTLNGKINYDEVLEMAKNYRVEYLAPRNDVEEKLAKIWSEILGFKKVGITNSFFELGGNSLGLMTLIAKIHREFDTKITLAQIFQSPTIEKQAELIGRAVETHYVSVKPVEKKDYYSLSSAQKRLYILQKIDVESTAYNLFEFYILKEDVNSHRLEQAFRHLINRHESLRTSFTMVNAEPMQRVLEYIRINFSFELFEPESSQSVDNISKGFVRPFYLDRAPLLRVGYIKIGKGGNVLLVDMHHIISDGVSHDILVRDFLLLSRGEQLPELALQYKDYSEWQRNEKRRGSLRQQEAFWINQYKTEAPLLNLPMDYPRPNVMSFEGKTINFSFGEAETRRLYALVEEQGVTLYIALLGIFTILLSKLSGQEDIIVGTPIAGRRHADLEQIIGMFVNMLALRNVVKDNSQVSEFLREVKVRTLDALDNQEYPFEDLVEKVTMGRDISRNPLFDTVLVLQNQNRPSAVRQQEEANRNGQDFIYEAQTSRFDITLSGMDRGGRLFFTLDYKTKLFKKETITKFINQVKRLFSSVLQDPAQRIVDLEITTPEEKRHILAEFVQEKAFDLEFTPLHQLFEEQAAKSPHGIALSLKDDQLTYRQLDGKANQLAGAIQKRGCKPNFILSIIIERSLEMVVGLLGILKAGAAYLPIDPEYPPERKKYILKDSGVDTLITADRQNSMTPNTIDITVQSIWGGSSDSPGVQLNPLNIAYVIYTSGTTGRPKGVLIRHLGVSNMLLYRKACYRMDCRDVTLQLFPFSFDGFVTSLFTPLISGAKVVLCSENEIKEGMKISGMIGREGVTHFICVPSLYRVILEYVTPEIQNSLRAVTLAGEKVTQDLLEMSVKKNQRVKILNEYGVTECSVMSTIYEYHGQHDEAVIGRPIGNTKIYILDRLNRLQPMGVPGELCIAGLGVAYGYLNNPLLSVKKFIHNPFSEGEILYKTGDIARWMTDGNIQFLGRMDEQVKIRGYRIELAEIEYHLLNHTKVKDAVVLTSPSGDGHLSAYIVPANKQPLSVPELRLFLSRQLPDYMLPSYYKQVEKIPLTSVGKIDRMALYNSSVGLSTGVEYKAPHGKIEKIIADIWKKLLNLDNPGVNDNFFDLGGNSLNIIQANVRINETLGIEIPVMVMFQYPTIGSLANYLDQSRRNETLKEQENKESEALSKLKESLDSTLQIFS
jgi:amino acid adenylation domain-containing protein